MKLPRNLNGNDLVRCLVKNWKYRIVHQVGSHVVLETDPPAHQRISVPAHNPLRVGTLNAILRTIAVHKGVSKADILGNL